MRKNLTIRATTATDALDAIPYVDMRRHAIKLRNYAAAVIDEQGDQIVLEYVDYADGVAVLFSPVFGYAYANQSTPGAVATV